MKDVAIVICGAAGQGIATVEDLITGILKQAGYHCYSTSEFMSRIRGGTNSTLIRVSSTRINPAFVDRIDILVPLHSSALPHLKHRISATTIILGEEKNIDEQYCVNQEKVIKLPFSEIAKEIGGAIYANIVAVGIFLTLFEVEEDISEGFLTKRFTRKGENIVKQNIEAYKKGYSIGKELVASGKFSNPLRNDTSVIDDIVLSGAEAIGMGAVAGGCNFISSYPMSPSTSVLVFLSQQADNFDIIVDQAEDEIAAINKGIAAWYAGGRGMITTSGGGFALMTEGVSLAGMLETPMVLHIGQRPGPATGLPTRTGQEDLQHVLNAGHGEFARIILTPGNPQDAFFLTQKAFNLADKFQVPVFILTDQFFLDSHYSIPDLDMSKISNKKQIVKTTPDYKRYRLTDNGISPRGIPGYGNGLVNVDSDEHDEDGHITEDVHVIRPQMVQKRLYKRLALLKKEVIEPELIGNEDYKTLVIGWGSTYGVIKEAVENMARDDLAFLYFKQVYPLNDRIGEFLRKAEKTIILENNATSQFGKVLKLELNFDADEHFLKYNGMPFSVEEVTTFLEENL
ncbi:MAG: 2-oxoacid:acceptor oxidoreductase subunit alpha [Candidatus Heimdallarchaeota archaeon]|nr:MAG: 2-oxoacid:acceptor oxidoreductase subunit alpha [Candidatus Heimdallarchaeota archaeon]